MHDRLAARALGAGHAGRHRRRRIDLSHYYLDQWRLMHIGAQPVPPSLIRRWQKVFPNHQYDTNYGLSESIGPGCVHLGVENIDKVGAIGKPGYGWEAKIVDEDGQEVRRGEVGELSSGARRHALLLQKPRGHRRGAQGRLALHRRHGPQDEDGFILPRRPQEGRHHHRRREPLPRADRGLPAPQRQDQGRGRDRPARRATGRDRRRDHRDQGGRHLHGGEINEFCRELPRYKRPRKIIFDKVPRNPTGKIEKPVLRERYRAERLVEAQTTQQLKNRLSELNAKGKLPPQTAGRLEEHDMEQVLENSDAGAVLRR
jgi:hypothetical protein